MEQKLVFREKLSEIKMLASENGNKVTVQQVKSYFENAQLSEEHLEMVFDYLLSQQVQVEGYNKASVSMSGKTVNNSKEDNSEAGSLDDDSWQQQDESFIFYEEELKTLHLQVSSEEEMNLFKLAAVKNELARAKLIEIYLKTVVEIAKEHAKENVVLSDLIQEGNVGLMLSMDKLPREGDLERYRAFVTEEIHTIMEDYIKELEDFKYAGRQIEEKVNYLNSAIKNLEEELEKKISIEELSTYLEMPAAEIVDILRMAGDEIEVVERNEIPFSVKKRTLEN